MNSVVVLIFIFSFIYFLEGEQITISTIPGSSVINKLEVSQKLDQNNLVTRKQSGSYMILVYQNPESKQSYTVVELSKNRVFNFYQIQQISNFNFTDLSEGTFNSALVTYDEIISYQIKSSEDTINISVDSENDNFVMATLRPLLAMGLCIAFIVVWSKPKGNSKSNN